MEDWEKELRQKHHYEDLIINRPEAMTSLRQRTEISVTTVGWVIWFMVCRPLFILFLWIIGFRFFVEHMIDLGGLGGLLDMWIIYASIIFTIYVSVRGWNIYNKIVYGKKNRRVSMPPVTPQDLESFFKIGQGTVARLQSSGQIKVDFKPDNKLIINAGNEANEGYFRPS